MEQEQKQQQEQEQEHEPEREAGQEVAAEKGIGQERGACQGGVAREEKGAGQ